MRTVRHIGGREPARSRIELHRAASGGIGNKAAPTSIAVLGAKLVASRADARACTSRSAQRWVSDGAAMARDRLATESLLMSRYRLTTGSLGVSDGRG